MSAPEETRRRHRKLREEIARHDVLYFVHARPEISDAQYDALYRELVELEARYPELVTPDSPTQKVGGTPIKEFEKAAHSLPMLSLGKTYTEQEVRDWMELMERELGRRLDSPFTVEPKIDGDSLELTYENGRLVLASTRGDGRVGENVTHSVKTLRSVPLSLRMKRPPELLEVRGEAYITLDDFRKLNGAMVEKGEEPFANPRNLTAGSLKQLDPKITASRPLRFMAHGAGRIRGARFNSHRAILEFLREGGIPIVEHLETCTSVEEIFSYHRRMLGQRDHLPYEIDGVVVKADDLTLREALGTRTKSPRWAIAYKFPAREEVTQLLAVDWQVGRTGKLTPVARLKPAEIGGVTVRNATLHNPSQIEKLDVRIGDWIVVTRSGDVIPYVVKSIPSRRTGPEKKIRPPEVCPVCTGPVEWTDTDLFCTNALSCPDQLRGAIDHWCSRAAMNIEGIGPEWLDRFVEKGILKSPADLYVLKTEQLLDFFRMGEKLAQNILDAIASSKVTTLARLVHALGIRHVGEATANALADYFQTLEALMGVTVEELRRVHDVGPKVAESIYVFFQSSRNRTLIRRVLEAGVTLAVAERKSNRFEGEVVVFTGGLELITRDEARKRVQEHGGKTSDGVSKTATLVVAGPGAGSKLERARKLGLRVIDEKEFLKRIGQ